MTALAGLWNFAGRPDAGEACRRMLAPQRIYGPHGEAIWDAGNVALGRALFETLPEDRHDRGPTEGGGGRYHLVADLRLDNRDELGEALGIAPAEAARMPDAAFLMRAWERWQEQVFEHLYGDYAFALWDAPERRLILARDHLGHRPLHYHLGQGFVAFASMPKGLHALPEVPHGPDEVRVAEMLALLPETGPRSFFRDISRVETGHFVTITPQRVSAHRHWNPTPASIATWRGDSAVEALRSEFDRAVRVRLRGCGERVGSHLSAGLDSSGVTATAARLLGDNGRVHAFTSVPRTGYAGPTPKGRLGDEGPLAALTAALYPNVEHVRVATVEAGLMDGWDRWYHLLDRPMLNPCNQNWWEAINVEARRRKISVMLTGEMGNMSLNFAGMERLPELFSSGAWLTLFRELRALVRRGRLRWPGAISATIGPWIPAGMWLALQRARSGVAQELSLYSALSADRARAMKLGELARSRAVDLAYRPRKNGFETRLWVLQWADRGNFGKAALGGYGIDQRDPTSDRRLIEFCLSLPSELFLRAGQPAAIGREVLADRLPAAVLGERARGYQAAEWHESLAASRHEIDAELVRLAELPVAAQMLDLPKLRALIEDWPEDGWETPVVMLKYRSALLRGSVVGHFLRRATRSNL